jgi:hexosaminidase
MLDRRGCALVVFTVSLVLFADISRGQNNLALNKPVANSSQGWRKYVKERAVDGDQLQGSRWLSQFSRKAVPEQEEWLQVDLEKTHTIDKVRILWQRTWWAKDYEIQVSADAVKWTTVYSVADSPDRNWIHPITFEPVAARYVRLLCRKPFVIEGQYKEKGLYGGYSVVEFEVYEKGKPFDRLQYASDATGKPVQAKKKLRQGYIVDGSMSTFWSSSAPPSWISVDMEDRVPIESIELYWHRKPLAYRIEVSDDQENWTVVGDETSVAVKEIGDEETKELHSLRFAPARTARYVRMHGTGASVEGPSYLLQELHVFRTSGMRSAPGESVKSSQ